MLVTSVSIAARCVFRYSGRLATIPIPGILIWPRAFGESEGSGAGFVLNVFVALTGCEAKTWRADGTLAPEP